MNLLKCCLHQIRRSRGQPLRQAVQTNNVSMGGCATACRSRWKWITELLISGPISGSGGTLQRLLASSGRVDRIRNCQIRSNPTRDSILGNRNRACQTPRCCVQSASLTPPGAAGRCYTRFSITTSQLNSSVIIWLRSPGICFDRHSCASRKHQNAATAGCYRFFGFHRRKIPAW